MASKPARKTPHQMSAAMINELRTEAAVLNKPSSWFCRKYNISSHSFYKYTDGILRPGSRIKANRPPDGDGRAKLVKPGSMAGVVDAARRAVLAQAAVDALGAGLPDGTRSTAVWTATRTELRTIGDQAKKFKLLGSLLETPATTLKQLEEVASACGFLVDVGFRSV